MAPNRRAMDEKLVHYLGRFIWWGIFFSGIIWGLGAILHLALQPCNICTQLLNPGLNHNLLFILCFILFSTYAQLMIRQRQLAAEAIETLRRQRELILNAAGEGVFGLDCEGRHTFVNPAAARMLGYHPAELLGRPSHEIYHHTHQDGRPYPAQQCPIYAAYKDGAIHNGDDEVFWKKNGQSIPVEYTSTPIWEGGILTGAVVVFRDISERLHTLEALQTSERRYREQYHRLQESQARLIQVEKMAALGRLVASIAHEINNPIQAINNGLTLVEEEILGPQRPDKLHTYLSIARAETDRIATIVRRMREFYRPQTERTARDRPEMVNIDDFYRLRPEERQAIDLPFILDEVLKLTNKQLQHHRIRIATHYEEPLPCLEGSADHLKQVFLNLVLNAIDAMAGRGGVLAVTAWADQNWPTGIRLEFSDTGDGMPPEVVSRLFEPLFTTKADGSGFGLFTSFKIIEAHHGRISVDSRPGLGTTFTIFLPLTQPVSPLPEPAP